MVQAVSFHVFTDVAPLKHIDAAKTNWDEPGRVYRHDAMTQFPHARGDEPIVKRGIRINYIVPVRNAGVVHPRANLDFLRLPPSGRSLIWAGIRQQRSNGAATPMQRQRTSTAPRVLQTPPQDSWNAAHVARERVGRQAWPPILNRGR